MDNKCTIELGNATNTIPAMEDRVTQLARGRRYILPFRTRVSESLL